MALVEKIKIEKTETRFVPHAATWLSQGRWDDQEKPQAPLPGGKTPHVAYTDEGKDWTKGWDPVTMQMQR